MRTHIEKQCEAFGFSTLSAWVDLRNEYLMFYVLSTYEIRYDFTADKFGFSA